MTYDKLKIEASEASQDAPSEQQVDNLRERIGRPGVSAKDMDEARRLLKRTGTTLPAEDQDQGPPEWLKSMFDVVIELKKPTG